MGAYLELIASGRIDVSSLIGTVFPFEQAKDAYASLNSADKPLAVLLRYAVGDKAPSRVVTLRKAPAHDGLVRLSVIGAGSFVQGVHLPNMMRLRDQFRLRGVMARTGANAATVAKSNDASYATTDAEEILKDPETDLVLIGTRHDLHGALVLRALEAGKHVFVEKPLAISEDELAAIEAFYARPRDQVLLTGFNRRFSPAALAAKKFLAGCNSPMIVTYQMNGGYIPMDSWLHGPQGAGRNIGEACHIYDLFNFLTGAHVTGVSAHAIDPQSRHWARNDNFVATVTYDDGSVCTLTYTALGTSDYPKERMQIFAGGTVTGMNDFKSVTHFGRTAPGWKGAAADKGQMNELKELGACLRQGGAWPISLAEQLSATRISFEVEKQIAG